MGWLVSGHIFDGTLPFSCKKIKKKNLAGPTFGECSNSMQRDVNIKRDEQPSGLQSEPAPLQNIVRVQDTNWLFLPGWITVYSTQPLWLPEHQHYSYELVKDWYKVFNLFNHYSVFKYNLQYRFFGSTRHCHFLISIFVGENDRFIVNLN